MRTDTRSTEGGQGSQDYVQMARAYRRHRQRHLDVIDVLIANGKASGQTRVREIGSGMGNAI
jgi:hypothetical protein